MNLVQVLRLRESNEILNHELENPYRFTKARCNSNPVTSAEGTSDWIGISPCLSDEVWILQFMMKNFIGYTLLLAKMGFYSRVHELENISLVKYFSIHGP